MASKAQKLKQKKLANAIRAQASMPDAKPDTVTRPPVQMAPRIEAIRPTMERLLKGDFRMPTGPERKTLPAVDQAHDAVAKMHRAGLITDAQEQAARDWADLKAAVHAELGIRSGRSCLDMTPHGHDNDDGDPELMARWMQVEAELGSWETGCLDWTVILGHKPGNMSLFRAALDHFARL